MILVISHFGFEDRISVLIVPVPGYFLHLTLNSKYSPINFICTLNFERRFSCDINIAHETIKRRDKKEDGRAGEPF